MIMIMIMSVVKIMTAIVVNSIVSSVPSIFRSTVSSARAPTS